jgi:hypothetical protein
MAPYSIPAFRSLYLEPLREENPLSKATGFVVLSKAGPLLVTNRHVVTGTNVFTNENFGIPDSLRVFHHKSGAIGERVQKIQPLYSADEPVWFEHPYLGDAADFVALPLTDWDGVDLHCYDVFQEYFQENSSETFPPLAIGPTDSVSIIGFPFGKSSQGGFPIWVNGFLATELEETYMNKPVVLVDSRTREGQSGSPVVAYRPAGAPIRGADRSLSIGNGAYGLLLGIYSGRINKDSDIGIIWKLSALAELIESIESTST